MSIVNCVLYSPKTLHPVKSNAQGEIRGERNMLSSGEKRWLIVADLKKDHFKLTVSGKPWLDQNRDTFSTHRVKVFYSSSERKKKNNWNTPTSTKIRIKNIKAGYVRY